MLVYNDPKSRRSETAIVCGRITAAGITNPDRYELTLSCGERQYDMRVETQVLPWNQRPLSPLFVY